MTRTAKKSGGNRSRTLRGIETQFGPANSGKTTLLHLLDRALQLHPSRPLVYVVKRNPDGTGRYLFHAPELREPLKERVKGVWCETTVETVCGWIESCRRHFDLVLVDLGGRHAPGNEAIFERTREREEGMASGSAPTPDPLPLPLPLLSIEAPLLTARPRGR